MRRLTTARKISLFSLSTVIAIGISMGSSALLIKESEKWKRVSTVEMSSRQSSIDWQDRALVLWDGEIHDPLLSPPQQLNRCDGDGFSTSEYWTAIPHEIAPVGFLPTFPLLREGRISSLIPQGPITHAPSMLRTECANIAIPPPQTVPRLVFQSRVLSAEGPQTDSSFTKQCQIRPTLNLNKGFHHCPHSLRKKDVQFGLSELSIDYEKSLGESEDSCSRSELPTSRSQANPKEDEGVNWDSTNLGPSLADRSRTAHPDSEHRQHPPEECTRSNQNTSQLAATPPDEWQHSRKVLYLMYFLDSKNVLEDFRNRDPHQEWLDSRPKAARLIQDNLDSTHLPIAPHQSFGSEYHTFAPKVYKPGERLYGAEMETFRKVQRNENRVLHYFTWSQREKGLYRLESSPCPVDGYENSHFNLETSWNQFICWHLTGQDVCETDISGQHVCYCPKLMRQLLNPFPPNGAFQEILSTTLKHDPASTKPYLELDIRVHLTWCLVPSRIATSYPRFTLPDVAVQILIYRDGLSLVIPPIVMSLRKAIREMEENGHPITLYEDEIMMLCLSADPMIPCLDIFTSAAFRNSGDCGDTDSIFECHVPPTKTLHSPDPRQDSSWEEHSASEKQIPTDCRKDRCAGAQ
jgi:hypothetical protein